VTTTNKNTQCGFKASLSYPIVFGLLSIFNVTVAYPFLVCAIAKCRSLVPARLQISETGALPPLHHFNLVSFDKFGNLKPLPSGLGDQPLYLDHDGFFSVNGPLDLDFTALARTAITPVDHDSHPAIQPLISNIPGFSGENPQVSPDHFQRMNDGATSRSATSPLKLTRFLIML